MPFQQKTLRRLVSILMLLVAAGIYAFLVIHRKAPNPMDLYYRSIQKPVSIDSSSIAEFIESPGIRMRTYAHNNLTEDLVIDSVCIFDARNGRTRQLDFWIVSSANGKFESYWNPVFGRRSFELTIRLDAEDIVAFRESLMDRTIREIVYSSFGTFDFLRWPPTAKIHPQIVEAAASRLQSPVPQPDTGTEGKAPAFELPDTTHWWSITKESRFVVSTLYPQAKIDTIFTDQIANESEEDTAEGLPSYLNEIHTPLSLLGSFLSYAYSYEGSGGVHPICGTNYSTVDLRSKEEVPLNQLFSDDDIRRALLRDTIITKALYTSDTSSLSEVVKHLDGGCEIGFNEMLKHYRFGTVTGDSIDIAFGLPHGCEMMRGNFTTFAIRLAIPPSLSHFANRIQYFKRLDD